MPLIQPVLEWQAKYQQILKRNDFSPKPTLGLSTRNKFDLDIRCGITFVKDIMSAQKLNRRDENAVASGKL
jgi:hypothetical protein